MPVHLVYRCALKPLGSSGLVPYVLHYLSFVLGSLQAAWRIRSTGWRPDLIWASSPPLFTAISGFGAAKFFHCPWVLDVRDLWPDTAVAAGQLREGGLAYRIGKWMERFFYNRANYITCVSTPMGEYISRATATPVDVVYNGVPTETLRAALPPNNVRDSAARLLLYAGNLGRLQALDQLVRAVADLDADGGMKGWRVHMLGAGALRSELEALVHRLNIGHRIEIRPPVARGAMSDELAAASALFLSLRPDPVLAMTIPSKLFDYLATNKPIVAGIAGEGAAIARRTGGNLVYAPGDLAALKRTLLELFDRFEELNALASANCDVVRKGFSRDKSIAVLEDVFKQLCKVRK